MSTECWEILTKIWTTNSLLSNPHTKLLVTVFDSITIEHGTLNPSCAEGAPLPLWDAGAEIQDRENLKLSARQWTDPNKTTENDKPSYQHTGKGPCQTGSEREVTGKFFVDVWGTVSMFSFPMRPIFPNVFQPCSSNSVDLGESDPGGDKAERARAAGPRVLFGLAEQKQNEQE